MSLNLPPNPKGWRYQIPRVLSRVLAIFAGTFLIVILIGFFLEYQGRIFTSDVLGIQEIAQATPELLQPSKTLWDLFQLLIIPIVVALGAAFLELGNRERQLYIEEERLLDQKIRDYLANIQKFILESRLLEPPDNKDTRALAQAFTRDLTKVIYGKRVGLLVDFLESYGLGLICGEDPVLSLEETTLKEADFQDLRLSRVNLRSARMKKSNWKSVQGWDLIADNCEFYRADMRGARFYNCDFKAADFRKADLRGVSFDSCDLRGAQLDSARLQGATFYRSLLYNVSWNSSTRFDKKVKVVFELINGTLNTRNLENFDLNEYHLANLDLRDYNLRGAKLYASDLSNTDLRGANLSEAVLYQAELKGIAIDGHTELHPKWKLVADILTNPTEGRDLQGADLRHACLEEACLRGANLTNARLEGANLLGADLSGADLSGAILQTSEAPTQPLAAFSRGDEDQAGWIEWLKALPERVRSWLRLTLGQSEINLTSEEYFGEVLLTYANLSGANLSGVDLTDRGLELVNLSQVVLSEQTKINAKWKQVCEIMARTEATAEPVCLAHQDLSGAYLRKVDLSSAELTHTNLEFCDLEEANLQKAKLRHANLSYASLRKANLSNADMTCAILHDANLDETKLTHTKLAGADLRNASFCEARLNDTDFSTAIVHNTKFRGCKLKRTTLPENTNLR